jgi:very-short-patch-repair endonuclease
MKQGNWDRLRVDFFDFREGMEMFIVLALGVVLVIGFFVFMHLKSQGLDNEIQNPIEEAWPFYAKKPLSEPEQVLYFRLVEALPEHIILAQVQLSRLLGVKKGNNNATWNNRINRMSVDFVVCNKDSSIVAAIELDDSTHQREDRQSADAKKDKALSSAGVRIVRWHVKSIPDVTAIQIAVK